MSITYLQSVRALASSPWITLLSLLLTSASLLLAIHFYLRGRKQKLPKYALRSSSLVRGLVNRVQGLEVLYGGRQIEDLTVSRIAFWNAGRETINYADVATIDPIIVQIGGGAKILEAKIILAKNPANQFRIRKSEEENQIQIEFEYIDQHEGLIIQFFHTGIDDSNIRLKGTIKGAPRPVRTAVETRVSLPHPFPMPPGFSESTMSRRSAGLILIMTPLCAVLLAALLGAFSGFAEHHPRGWDLLFVLVAVIWCVSAGILLIRRSVPRGFEDFETDF